MPQYTDTNVNQLVINKMTKAQYDSITPSDTELYLVPDEIDSTPTSGSTNCVESGGVYSALQDKLDAPSTAGTSGQVLTSDGQGSQSWQTPTSAVSDVTVGGTSVVTNGVAVVPSIPDVSGKLDKVSGATYHNFPRFDSLGDLEDSGFNNASFANKVVVSDIEAMTTTQVQSFDVGDIVVQAGTSADNHNSKAYVVTRYQNTGGNVFLTRITDTEIEIVYYSNYQYNDTIVFSYASLPTNTSDLTNDGSDGTSTYVEADELAAVATSGSYNDLSDKPLITPELVEMSYGESNAWTKFINAYTAKCIVYCRASSNSNPASGSQTRKAFLAYVNNETSPTEVEFQYYRSVATHSNSQLGDQVFVYKLTPANGGTWTVTMRNAFTKVVAGTNMSSSYSNGAITFSASIPTISTDIASDNSDNTKTAGAKAVYDAINPAYGSSQPQNGMLPNILYKLGTLSGSVTIAFATPSDTNIENEYKFTFTADSTAPTITWPSGITWIGNSIDNGAPKVEADTYYEVSVLDGYGIFNKF